MYGVYDEIVKAARKALWTYEENCELLEYPEVQADKAYYLSVLEKYNFQCALKSKTDGLLKALEERAATQKLILSGLSDEEKSLAFEELSSLDITISELAAGIAKAVGCTYFGGAYCRIKATNEACAAVAEELIELIKGDLSTRGGLVKDLKTAKTKNGGLEAEFYADGEGALTRLKAICGVHKVIAERGGELFFGVTTAPQEMQTPDEREIKIDLFHSSGAGGQNINKVETAVRVTHLPTGTVVVCQDERSQLKNKKRALAELAKRLKEQFEREEKGRIEEEFARQQKDGEQRASFNLITHAVTDKRLHAFKDVPLPLTQPVFSSYIDALISKGR